MCQAQFRPKASNRMAALKNIDESKLCPGMQRPSGMSSSPTYSPLKRADRSRRRRRSSQKKSPHLAKFDDSSTMTASTSDTSCDASSDDFRLSPKPSRTRNSNGHYSSSYHSKKSRNIKRSHNLKPSIVSFDDITSEERARYVALDAEMVGVGYRGLRSALARVSLVNWEGEVLFDSHVRVEEPVTDYRTYVSGITASDLESENAICFEECQYRVKKLIQDKIVVGHGLKNDFKVLHLIHPWFQVRDTAKYEPFMKTGMDPTNPANEILVPKKLKVLSKDKLGLIIQEDGQCHNPIEDAIAAMELYKKHRLKWEKSVEWKKNKTKMILGE